MGDLALCARCHNSLRQRTWTRDVDACSGSSKVDDGSPLCCPKGHSLLTFVTPRAGFYCDLCRKTVAKGTVLHGCRLCDYVACEGCLYGLGPPSGPLDSISEEPRGGPRGCSSEVIDMPSDLAGLWRRSDDKMRRLLQTKMVLAASRTVEASKLRPSY